MTTNMATARREVLTYYYSSTENKNFSCPGQLIIVTPIQAVKLPTTMVTRLPSPFDENELELWFVEFW